MKLEASYSEKHRFKVLLFSSLSFLFIFFITKAILPESSIFLSVIISLAIAYLLYTSPNRIIRYTKIKQSSESEIFDSYINSAAYIMSSKTRPILLTDWSKMSISPILRDIKRLILLGITVKKSFIQKQEYIFSESLKNSIKAYTSKGLERIANVDEFSREVLFMQENYETKSPIFVAVCFFSPVLLLILILFAHLYTPEKISFVLLLDVIIVDIGFFFSSAERKIFE